MDQDTDPMFPHDMDGYRKYRVGAPLIGCDVERTRTGRRVIYLLTFPCPWGCMERRGKPKRHIHGGGNHPLDGIGARSSHCYQAGAPSSYVVLPADELERWRWMDAHGGPEAWTQCAQCIRVFAKGEALAIPVAGREMHFCGQECAARMARDILQEAMPPEFDR